MTFEKSIKLGVVLIPETEAIYTNYKEPLTPTNKGFGYMGTLAKNKTRTHVQCHVCGYFYRSLAKHTLKHKLTAREYKSKFGLLQKTSLCGDNTIDKHCKAYADRSTESRAVTDRELKKHQENIRSGKIKPGVKKVSVYPLERRNLNGNCPEQILDKLRKLANELGKTPTAKQYQKKYGSWAAIITVYGTYNEAVRLAGLTIFDRRMLAHKEPFLLECLRVFWRKHGRTVMHSDFGKGQLPGYNTYRCRWGTLNNARAAAGIPVIVPVGNKGFVEVPLESVGVH